MATNYIIDAYVQHWSAFRGIEHFMVSVFFFFKLCFFFAVVKPQAISQQKLNERNKILEKTVRKKDQSYKSCVGFILRLKYTINFNTFGKFSR